MKHRLTERAAADLADAVEYYESREAGVGIRFALEVGLTLANVLQAPERWAEIEPGIRKRNMDQFPYALIYRKVNRGVVELVAIFHLRREPGSWRKT